MRGLTACGRESLTACGCGVLMECGCEGEGERERERERKRNRARCSAQEVSLRPVIQSILHTFSLSLSLSVSLSVSLPLSFSRSQNPKQIGSLTFPQPVRYCHCALLSFHVIHLLAFIILINLLRALRDSVRARQRTCERANLYLKIDAEPQNYNSMWSAWYTVDIDASVDVDG